MPTATDADKERFRALIPDASGVEVKPMFGQLGGFVNGNMFAGLFGDTIGVKLDDPDAAALRELGGGPFGPAERPMGGYTTIPGTVDAEAWVGRSLQYVGALPPKAKKVAPKK